MVTLASRNADDPDERRSNALRGLLMAVATTTALILPGLVWTVVSVAATLAAVAGGLLIGAAVSVAGDRYRLEARNDARATAAALGAIVVATLLVWILVPGEHMPTVLQFTLAFTWSFSLTAVARHVIRPTITGTEPTRE